MSLCRCRSMPTLPIASTRRIRRQLGGRVIVPFRNEKLIGVVTRLHDEPPPVEAKTIERILDEEAIVSPQLLELARWISQYYLAPLGEVLRTMLPLVAEVRKQVVYRIAEAGERTLQAGAEQGSSRRTRRTPEEQSAEYAVLNFLLSGEPAKRSALMRATGASRELIDGMVRKKWISRETVACSPRRAPAGTLRGAGGRGASAQVE